MALKNGSIVEIWNYNPQTGAKIGKLTSTTTQPPGTVPGTLPGNPGTRLPPTTQPGIAVATDLTSFQTVCQAQAAAGNPSKRATWDYNMAGGGGCNCGGFSISAQTYLQDYAATDRAVFPQACSQSLGGVR